MMSNKTREVIQLSEEDDEEDRVREDVYEDFDELADLAITSSEPPPPGTRPLQEELLTLMENTVSGITINKEEVVAWLRNEDALLTGESSRSLYPSPPSSGAKFSGAESISEGESEERSSRSPPKKKSRGQHTRPLSSVAVKLDRPPHRRDSRTHTRDSRNNRPSHRSQEVHKSRSSTSHSRRQSPAQRRHSPVRSRQSSRQSSPQHSVRARLASPARHRLDARRSPQITMRTSFESRRTNRAAEQCSRRVKIQRKVENEEDDRNTSKYYHKEATPVRKGRITGDKLVGVRDARELISRPRATTPPTITDYIRNLELQIRNSEKGARMLVAEARNAKRDLDKYLEDSELKELTTRREERRRGCTRRKEGDRLEERSRDARKPRERTREKKKSHDNSSKRPHANHSRDSRSRKSHSSERVGGEDPASWKIIPPSEVDGFNCGGPAIFVQSFSRNVTRKHLFAFFKSFGTIMDVQILELGRRRTRSACVIFSRQSEADKAINLAAATQEEDLSVDRDMVTPPSTFDILLSALRSDPPIDAVAVV